MYLPLHAAIIASLFEWKTDCQKDFQSLKTMTQLFDELTRSLIHRQVVKNRDVPDDFAMPRSLLHTVPSVIANQFYKLIQMAYDGLKNEEYIFTELQYILNTFTEVNKAEPKTTNASVGGQDD